MPNLPNEPLADLLDALYAEARALYLRPSESVFGPMCELTRKLHQAMLHVRYGAALPTHEYPVSEDEYLP